MSSTSTGSGGAPTCLVPAAVGADPIATFDTSALEAQVGATVTKYHVPAASVALARGGKVLWASAFGDADPLASPPRQATRETPFALGSLSKPFLGVMILQLVDAQLLSLDADVDQVLGYSVRNPLFPDVPVLVRQLLTHTSAISDAPFTYDSTYYVAGDSPIAFSPFVAGYFDAKSPYYGGASAFTGKKPGDEICYSNMGAALLGAIIEKVSHEALPDHARKTIFEPLGMTRTSYAIRDFCAPQELARGCDEQGGAIFSADNGQQGQPESHPELASGVLRSTALDMARFVSAIQLGGELDGVRILSTGGVKELVRPQLDKALPECADGRVQSENQGLMWIHFPFQGDDYVGHYGGIYGFYTAGYYRVSDGLVVSVLLNRIEVAAMTEIELALLAAVPVN